MVFKTMRQEEIPKGVSVEREGQGLSSQALELWKIGSNRRNFQWKERKTSEVEGKPRESVLYWKPSQDSFKEEGVTPASKEVFNETQQHRFVN